MPNLMKRLSAKIAAIAAVVAVSLCGALFANGTAYAATTNIEDGAVYTIHSAKDSNYVVDVTNSLNYCLRKN